MVDPRTLLIIIAISGVVWIGGETVVGLRWVKHHTKSAIHYVLHPHKKP
jgi:hypothetical protein